MKIFKNSFYVFLIPILLISLKTPADDQDIALDEHNTSPVLQSSIIEETCGILCSPQIYQSILYKSLKELIDDLELNLDDAEIEEVNDDYVIARLKDDDQEAELYCSTLVDGILYKSADVTRVTTLGEDMTITMNITFTPSTALHLDFNWLIPGTPYDMYLHRVALTYDEKDELKKVHLVGRRRLYDREDSYQYTRDL